MQPSGQTWPTTLWLVRHGESAGNVARQAAEAAGAPTIDLAHRDVDVPLSPRGEAQADALGAWIAGQPEGLRPTVVLSSPYVRALETAARVAESTRGGSLVLDERLREIDFGSLSGLTRAGIAARFPQEAQARAGLGKFYYRPPGGESWCDVIHRLRSVLVELQHAYPRERVVIVAHQVIVLCFRYLLERLTEGDLLAIDREGDVANASITSYTYVGGRTGLALETYNFVAPGMPVTNAADATPA